MKKIILFIVLVLSGYIMRSQNLPDSCKLSIGTNLAGLADWGTELPFVDMMHNSREWYTKDVNNPSGGEFNTGFADSLSYRPDGYPTHLPQTVTGSSYQQTVATIWAVTDGWEAGKYVVLFDGTGSLSFWGGFSNLVQTSPNRYTFDFNNPVGNILEMRIVSSSSSNPIRNIRLLMPGSEATYMTQPFNPVWLNKLKTFKSVRFMDWGQTNNWGQKTEWDWDDPALFNWAQRQPVDYYTWTTRKGIPYEMMIKLMNDFDLDGWVCVPHRASHNYIENMAQLFHANLEPQRKLTVEYSNEIWNWMFGQAQWCNKYGCVEQGVDWPEGTVQYIQNCLDIWTNVYGPDSSRIVRAVGLQTGWADVSRRIVFNMRSHSFDVVSPTYYFGLGEQADEALDALGSSAKVSDVAHWARVTREGQEKPWINEIKKTISDALHIPMAFYEGGQHLTPTPFGNEPTYAQALLDIQRDTAMYHLYNEWFDYIRTLQSGTEPLILMNFSFISGRSARYGSWGILETMNQDTSVIPAPKYKSVIENQNTGCNPLTIIHNVINQIPVSVFPNPCNEQINVQFFLNSTGNVKIEIYNVLGNLIFIKNNRMDTGKQLIKIDSNNWTKGVYLLKLHINNDQYTQKLIIK